MGVQERAYQRRVQEAFTELESEEHPPRSAEEAFSRFLDLMEAVMPVIEQTRTTADPDVLVSPLQSR